MSSDTSIADLHYYMQIIMSWEGIHLHQFIIRGKSYGIYYAGGMSFRENPRCSVLIS
ncbi:IS1096 element passenger TnpR family protein [Candidatus Jidaibacter acanthamoebae]|uniref:IS1096 element passenger TnpR family protein n=1 Tax=Candidatus Jidaibacter acanthamoebae TaxID=86105 RepID=UPI003977561B